MRIRRPERGPRERVAAVHYDNTTVHSLLPYNTACSGHRTGHRVLEFFLLVGSVAGPVTGKGE